ncbi:pentapeptide repeat protein [Streptomyces sp. 3211.6]|uniref:pentapeptide repeat-containing protein n=1 Tax=Streptomyces sp. 3211.6 TaxID=1938845 RepID=UPI000EB2CD93|nr:pentapeptide repeat-containing protein [Streptomyces sp. 3211.6]RKT07607.1 pentapeptide repeat protein [Streptomyces sp. 3211.6]
MIEKLLAAFGEGAEAGAAPRTAIGAEEIADILWLAARVDPAAADARTPAPAADGAEACAPPPDPPDPPAGPAPAPGAGTDQLFPATTRPGPPDGRADGASGRRGVPLRLPRTASLDDPLGLMRSLRPVGRRSIGGPGEELDEQLTVERSIEAMVPTPVLRPAESRWLDLALVVDAHHSMLLWADLVAELRGVLTRSGVFRDVRTWQLTGTGRGGTPQLARGPGGPPRNPLELADPAGRRLILVLSDTVAGGWQEAPLRAVLRHWSSHNAVAVLNVLPERLWTRGAVAPVPFAVRSERPAAATRSWQRVPAARRARGGGPVVPVVGLASGSLARLVRVVSGDGRWRRLACLRLDAGASVTPPVPGPARPAADPLELVERFRAGASPTAQQLAAHLAAVPLTLPVMTLVRRSLLRGSEHGHLAEVALGGLFAPWRGQQRPEEAEFEFLPGVREVLLGSQLRGDVAEVRELVRRRVWEYMSRNRGTGPDFSATRVTTGTEGRRLVPEGALPFAERGPVGERGPGTDREVGERRGPGAGREPGAAAAVADPGPGGRVVRVGFDPLREPGEVGILLAPRLVLTVGQAAGPGETVWVRAGGREFACRPVWWDDASPPVLLLESERDLTDPAGFVPQPWGTAPAGAAARVRVDGATEAGQPAALTATLVRDGGAANGELVLPSPDPETWTHFVGAPVSHEGRLLGVVHTVYRDRLVFLTAAALLEQPAFRAALDGHPAAVPHLGGDEGGPQVTVDVRVGQGAVPRGSSAGAELRDLMARLMTDAQVRGTPVGGEGSRTLHVVLNAPGALGRAGRLLAALPATLARYGDGPGQGVQPPLAMVLGTGDPQHPLREPERLIEHDLIGERLRSARRGRTGRLLLVLSQRLYEELGALLGPTALSVLTPLGDGAGAWVYEGGPRQLAELLTEADESARGTAVTWHRCRAGASDTDPLGCPGSRLLERHACLAHLPPGEQEAVLSSLGPGSSVDFRGIPLTQGLLRRVLDAVREPGTGQITLGAAAFAQARFVDGWEEEGVVFTGAADFSDASFAGPVDFSGAVFRADASFDRAVFEDTVGFPHSRFEGRAGFRRAVFRRGAHFTQVTWKGDVCFQSALMGDFHRLRRVTVEGEADFRHVRYEGSMLLEDSTLAGPVSFESAVWRGSLSVADTRFMSTAVFDLARCEGIALLRAGRFNGPARFASTVFEGAASFSMGAFEEAAVFTGAAFNGRASFASTVCAGGVSFDRTVFSGSLTWRDMTVENGPSSFADARFLGPVSFLRTEFVTGTGFDGAAFDGTVTLADTTFRAGLTFDGTAFNARTEFTGVKFPGSLPLPGDWTARRSDAGLWYITSPHPAASLPEDAAPDDA